MEDRPLVTIAIPTYNGEAHVAECLRSAQRQTYAETEILILDDHSADCTLDIAQRASSDDPRIRIVEHPRRLGLPGNFTACLTAASGTWVKYLCQDDLITRTCVEEMVAARHDGCPIVVCGRRYLYDGPLEADVRRGYEYLLENALAADLPSTGWLSPTDLARIALRHLSLNVLGVNLNFLGEPDVLLVERESALRVGAFDPRFCSLHDLEFALRLGLEHGVVVVPKVLTTFRVHPDQATAVNRRDRLFRTEQLDLLLYVMTLAYSPAYAHLREIGLAEHPPIDVPRAARVRAADVWRMSRPRRRQSGGSGLRRQWRRAIRRDPVVGRYVSTPRIFAVLAEEATRRRLPDHPRLAAVLVSMKRMWHPREASHHP